MTPFVSPLTSLYCTTTYCGITNNLHHTCETNVSAMFSVQLKAKNNFYKIVLSRLTFSSSSLENTSGKPRLIFSKFEGYRYTPLGSILFSKLDKHTHQPTYPAPPHTQTSFQTSLNF